jgi:hypothetical protein
MHTVEKDASRAQIDLADWTCEAFGTPPAHHALGLGPRLEYQVARRIEDARYYDFLLLGLPCGTASFFLP